MHNEVQQSSNLAISTIIWSLSISIVFMACFTLTYSFTSFPNIQKVPN